VQEPTEAPLLAVFRSTYGKGCIDTYFDGSAGRTVGGGVGSGLGFGALALDFLKVMYFLFFFNLHFL
jgi:hypothetical protein